MPSGKKHKDFKASSNGAAEVVLGGGTYVKKETPGNVHGKLLMLFFIDGLKIFFQRFNFHRFCKIKTYPSIFSQKCMVC